MRSATFIQSSAACLLILAALPAAATVRTWPGSAPCNTTLQACIAGSTNGDTIEIASNSPIDEEIDLNDRSLTVRAANGYRPRLAPGHLLSIMTSSAIGNQTVNVSGISLMYGYVVVFYNGTGTGTYDLRDIEAGRFTFAAASGTVNAVVYNNRITGPSGGINGGLMQLQNGGAVLNADIWFNQIRTTSAGLVDGSGILVDEAYGASGTVRLHGNTVRGAFRDSAIQVTEGLPNFVASSFDARVYNNVTVCGGTTDLNGGNGIGFVVYDGNINIQVVNNTVSNCYRGISASHWAGAGAGTSTQIDGLVWNNLIVANYGLSLNQPLASTVTNNYNLINATHNTSGGFALGANTILSPAKLVSSGIPRLAAASPAIGAAHLPTLGLGLIANGLPVLDADGLRRMKGAAVSDPDIGAYEYGDLGFMHTASATSNSHVTSIVNPATDGNAALDIFATPNFTGGGTGPEVSYNQPFGSWYTTGHWTLFGEDTAVNVPANAHFNVFVPALGDGRFRHVATAVNSSTWSTTLDDGSLNNTPNSIVLVNQNFTAGPQYNPHPVGVFYFASGGSGKWFITNLDQLGGGNMPLGAGFSVYAQAPSPNAFRATQSSSSNSLRLDHPLLNNTPCAQVSVTRMSGTNPATGNFDVYYAAPSWYIWSYAGSIAPGDQFNVVINPAQVELCSDVIFANGFE